MAVGKEAECRFLRPKVYKGAPMGEKSANKRKGRTTLAFKESCKGCPYKKDFLHIIPFMFQRLYRQSKGADFHSPLT